MSALLTSGRGIAALPIARPVAPEPVADPRDAMIDALRGAIAGLRTAAALAAADADARIAEASARSARDARSAVRRDDTARVALLERAIATAQGAFEARLAQLDRLAPALARVVLDRLFGDGADRTPLVEALVVRRLALFRREAIVAVAVSAADFDEPALAGLATRIAGIAVAHDPGLSGGQCRIDARVECLSLDLHGEWATLAAALDAMAEGGA